MVFDDVDDIGEDLHAVPSDVIDDVAGPMRDHDFRLGDHKVIRTAGDVGVDGCTVDGYDVC